MNRFVTLMMAFSHVASAADSKPRLDSDGLPLPPEAVRRFGSARFSLDRIRDIAFSPDGRVVYALGGFFPLGSRTSTTVLKAFDIKTGHPLWIVERPETLADGMALDPTGKHLWLTMTSKPKPNLESTRYRLRIDAKSGDIREKLELFPAQVAGGSSNGVSDGVLHPSGLLAWPRFDSQQSDLSLPIQHPDGTEQARWEPVGEWLEKISIARDGKAIFIGGSSYADEQKFKIRAVDAKTGKGLWSVDAAAVLGLTPTPDSRYLVIRSPGKRLPLPNDPIDRSPMLQQRQLRVLDAKTGKEVARIDLEGVFADHLTNASHLSPVRLVFHPDGQRAFVPGPAGKTIPIDLKTWSAGKAEGHSASLGWFSPDGKSYWVPHSRGLTGHDSTTHKPLFDGPPPLPTVWHAFGHAQFQFSANGGTLFRTFPTKEQVSWSVATGEELKREWPDVAAPIRSPDGKSLLRRTESKSWEVVVPEEKRTVPLEQSASWDICQFTPDGKKVLANSNSVRLWDAQTGKLTTVSVPDRKSFVSGDTNSVRFLAGTNRVAVMEYSGNEQAQRFPRIGLYDWAEARRVGEFTLAGQLMNWVSTPGGGLVILSWAGQAKPDTTLTILVPGRATPISHKLDSPAVGLAISPDERTIAVGLEKGILLLDSHVVKPRHTFVGLARAPDALAFSPDGKYLVSESADGPVLLWDVRTGIIPTPEPDAAALTRLYADLSDERPDVAFKALRILAAHPRAAVPLLKSKVNEYQPPKEADIIGRLAKLDSRDFKERDTAEKELRAMGAAAHAVLKRADSENATPERRQRVARLLAITETPQIRLARRLAEVVEWCEAKELLKTWEKSAWPELAAEARQTLSRLK